MLSLFFIGCLQVYVFAGRADAGRAGPGRGGAAPEVESPRDACPLLGRNVGLPGWASNGWGLGAVDGGRCGGGVHAMWFSVELLR